MTTYNQLLKRRLVCKKRYKGRMFNKPQIRGRVLKVLVMSPRKPNSARRKTCQVLLSTRKKVFAKIIGEGSIPNKYASVLIRGGGYRDTPQVNYTIIRGVLECLSIFRKSRRRSFFGVKKYIYGVNDKYE